MTAFMLVFPLVAMLSVPLIAWLMLDTASREARRHGLTLDSFIHGFQRLLAVTVLSCLGFLALWSVVPPHVVPPNVLALLVTLSGFHALWWGMAMPLVRAQNASLKAAVPQAPPDGRRAASLRPRQASDYLPACLLPLPWVIALIGCAVLAWRSFVTTVPPTAAAGVAVFVLCAVGELVLYRWWLHAEVKAPQALRNGGSAQFEREWESLRGFRVRAVFMMHCLMPAVFITFGVLLLEVVRGTISGSAVGLAGGIVGLVVGLAGGALGVLADIRRRRLDVHRTL